jgi:hypothetical protein
VSIEAKAAQPAFETSFEPLGERWRLFCKAAGRLEPFVDDLQETCFNQVPQ